MSMTLLQPMLVLAQDGDAGTGGMLAGLGIFAVVYLAFIIAIFAGMWTTLSKAGKPGWGCIIPFYNVYLWVETAGRPVLWFVLSVIFPPIMIIIFIDIAGKFGKGAGFGLGLVFLPFIFFPMLGFGSAQYNAAA